jgi:hypothetical protein
MAAETGGERHAVTTALLPTNAPIPRALDFDFSSLIGHYALHAEKSFLIKQIATDIQDSFQFTFSNGTIAKSAAVRWDPRLFNIVKKIPFYIENSNVYKTTILNLTRERAAVEELSLIFFGAPVWQLQSSKKRVDRLNRYAIAKQFRYDREQDLFIWTLQQDRTPPRMIKGVRWVSSEDPQVFVLYSEYGPCKMNSSKKDRFGIGYFSKKGSQNSRVVFNEQLGAAIWPSLLIHGLQKHFFKLKSVSELKYMVGNTPLVISTGTKFIFRDMRSKGADGYNGWAYDLSIDPPSTFGALCHRIGVPIHRSDEEYLCKLFSRNNRGWLLPLLSYNDVLMAPSKRAPAAISLFACGWSAVISCQFLNLSKGNMHAQLQSIDGNSRDEPISLTMTNFLHTLSANSAMVRHLQDNKPYDAKELAPKRIAHCSTNIPYRYSPSGPSYNETCRVERLFDDALASHRSELNKTILQYATLLRDSLACQYFHRERLPLFISLIRDLSGQESNRYNYDTKIEGFSSSEPTLLQISKFKLVVILRSINRVINNDWKDIFQHSFFRNEVLLGSRTSQQNALQSFCHNSNRNRWKKELFEQSVAAVRGKYLAFQSTFDQRTRLMKMEAIVQQIDIEQIGISYETLQEFIYRQIDDDGDEDDIIQAVVDTFQDVED